MRRFQLTGPEVFVGGVKFTHLANTVLVRDGKVAVLADDDPRCDDLARSPYFVEIIETPASDDGAGDTESTGEEEKPKKTRGHKDTADSGGV